MPRIQALLLDLGNVMTYFSHERMYEQMADVVGTSADHLRADLSSSGMLRDFDIGAVTGDDIVAWASATYGRPVDGDALRVACADIFTPNVEMQTMLTTLRAAAPHIRLVAITNTCAWHLDWVLEHDGVLAHMDAIAASHEVGAQKPDAAMYLRAVALAGVPAERCFYTDDIAAYIDAGRTHGIDAEVFTGNDSFRSQLVARGLPL